MDQTGLYSLRCSAKDGNVCTVDRKYLGSENISFAASQSVIINFQWFELFYCNNNKTKMLKKFIWKFFFLLILLSVRVAIIGEGQEVL